MQYTRLRYYIFHFACVLMLLLVHLDIYGYNLIHLLHTTDNKVVTETKTLKSTSSANDLLEWSDPVYRLQGSRQQALNASMIYGSKVLWIVTSDTNFRQVSSIPVPKSVPCNDIDIYLNHCLLII